MVHELIARKLAQKGHNDVEPSDLGLRVIGLGAKPLEIVLADASVEVSNSAVDARPAPAPAAPTPDERVLEPYRVKVPASVPDVPGFKSYVGSEQYF